MNWTDTHTHLYVHQFDNDRSEVLRKAMDQGVDRFFLPNIDLDSIASMKALVKQFPKYCFPMMGLHPCSVGADVEKVLGAIHQELDAEKYYAIGEIGIDLYWDKTYLKEQQWAFRQQIQWAKDRQLPIVIHCRDAFDEILEILDEVNDEGLFGIFHCFTGDQTQAEHIIAYGGFKLGIGGVLTFKNAGLDKVIANVDLEHLVLETDAPYLSPVPFRGKRNESAYLLYVAEKLAEIHQCPLEDIARITSENADQIFYKHG